VLQLKTDGEKGHPEGQRFTQDGELDEVREPGDLQDEEASRRGRVRQPAAHGSEPGSAGWG
jgi:hypothetical protein